MDNNGLVCFFDELHLPHDITRKTPGETALQRYYERRPERVWLKNYSDSYDLHFSMSISKSESIWKAETVCFPQDNDINISW